MWDLERRSRVPGLKGLTERAYDALAPLLPVTDQVFVLARELQGARAGTNDRLHLACCIVNGIETIVSNDRGLDGPHGVRRVDPTDHDVRWPRCSRNDREHGGRLGQHQTHQEP